MEADQQVADENQPTAEVREVEITTEETELKNGVREVEIITEVKNEVEIEEEKESETKVVSGEEEQNENNEQPSEQTPTTIATPTTEQQQDYISDQDKSHDAMIPRIILSTEDFQLNDEITNEMTNEMNECNDIKGLGELAVAITPVPGETDICQSRIFNQDEEDGNQDEEDGNQDEEDGNQDEEDGNQDEEDGNQDEEDGFDSDKENREGIQPSQLDDIIEEEESEEEFDRDNSIEHYKVLLSEFEKTQSNHSHLQHKIAEYLAKKKADEKPDPSRNVTDQEQRYQKCMDALEQLQSESKSLQIDFEAEEEHLKDRQRIKQEEIHKAWKIFSEFVKENAVTAVHSRTGRKLASQEIDQYLGMLERKDKDVNQVRLENVKLQNRMNKLEALIQQKEQLAEGLHMIDFEQLRINNVDLNEKIEDRNEEIHKLQKKVTSTVQVLAHLKEKLQFVQTQNSQKERQLNELDQEVAKKRDALNRLKHAKDAVRNENIHLKQRGGLVSHPVLLKDLEEQIDLRELMQTRLQDIQQRHSELTLTSNALKHKIDSARVLPL